MSAVHTEEQKLLLALSRVEPGPIAFYPAGGFDWDYVLRTAGKFGNTSLIEHNIRKAGLEERIPRPVLQRFTKSADYYRLREIFYIEELKEIGESLNTRGLPFILLKGPALSLFVYPAKGLRDYADLDLLVRAEDLPAVRRCLETKGYHEERRVENEVVFNKFLGGASTRSLNVLLELHLDLLNLLNFPHYARVENIDLAPIRNRARVESIDGVELRVLGPEDGLIYGCLHFFYHHDFRGLRYFSDIDAMIAAERAGIDWEKLEALAKAGRFRKKLFLILTAYDRNFPGNAMPDNFLSRISLRGTGARLFEKVSPPPEAIPFGDPGKSHHLPMVLALDRFRDMLIVAYYWFFPGKEFLKRYYHVEENRWRFNFHARYAATILKKGLARFFGRERR